ncbi:MAG TPA: type VI secretion system tube protein Hcp [Planctomycetota bacterium]|jgi:type VI protein secretion system component Hcp|nr:type VI secretion system tube protein Hcp [Planctomycetota bacterium]
MAGLKAFIKIGKLAGESAKDQKAKDGFHDLLSVSLGGSCNWDFAQEQQPTRMVGFSGVSVTKYVNGSSPILLIACLKEKLTKEVTIVIENDKGEDFFFIRLKDEVRITSDSLSFSGSEMIENVTFAGKTMEIEHKGKNKKDDIKWNKIEQKGAEI